jgi:hypothetical protein
VNARLLIAGLLAAAIAVGCGSSGGAAPVGGGATTAPKASDAPKSPLPSGNPDVDYYGY